MKERLMVQRLRNFIDNDKDYHVALVAGLRRTGKTTILRQLQKYYPDSEYIDLSDKNSGYSDIEDKFLFAENRPALLLLDEISYLDDYELVSQALYDIPGNHYKIIMTGSSSAHIIKLSETKLGGGRSKLFRLPVLTFVEYLYFTDKIMSYSDYQSVNNEYFAEYLQLKGLENTEASNLAILFNENYFHSFYAENLESNKNTTTARSIIELDRDDLDNLLNLIAYKLSEACTYSKLIRPNVGAQEKISLGVRDIKLSLSKIDISDAIVSTSSNETVKLSATDKSRIIKYLINSGLSYIQYTYDSPEYSPMGKGISIGSVLSLLDSCTKESELIELFEKLTVNIISPLFYTRLGDDIIKRADISLDYLFTGSILGKMVELYMAGAVLNWSINSYMTSIKLRYPEIGEVDIYDKKNSLIIEATIKDKHKDKINVYQYFADSDCIRICSSKDKDYFNKQYYQIPYAKLCCLIDTGDIFKLKKTVIIKNQGMYSKKAKRDR